MTRVERLGRDTFRALSVPNFRRFYAGQLVSVSGTWMQTVAQGWLVLKLTGSGVALGLVIAAQFLPMLVLGPWTGLVADRAAKRRLLLLTQSTAGVLALILGVLTLSGAVQLWMVYVLALGLGLVTAFDMPVRQTFVVEMVGPDLLANAVTLNSVLMNAGRLVGPALGGVLIAAVGIGWCFVLNALSYLAVLGAVASMNTSALNTVAPASRAKGQVREGFRYVWARPELRTPLLIMAVLGTLSYEFQVSLPLLAKFTFDAGAPGYGLLMSAMSLGAIVGGLAVAAVNNATHRKLGFAALALGSSTLVASALPSLGATLVMLPIVGASSIAFISMGNALLQLSSAPEMRGRVIALYGVAFLGSTPVGGPIIGWVGQTFGARWSLAVGGLAAVTVALAAWPSLRRANEATRASSSPAPATPAPATA
jgi:MFS family permease